MLRYTTCAIFPREACEPARNNRRGLCNRKLDFRDLEDLFPNITVESYQYFSQINVLFVTFSYLLTDFLTYFIEQNPLLEAKRFSASQEIPPFYGNQSFITTLTSACHLSLS